MSNEIRQHVALLQAVTCILGLDKGDDGLIRLADELTVGLDPWSQFEFALCRQEFHFGVGQGVAAGGAGFRSVCQLHNDSTDAVLIVEGTQAWCAVTGLGVSRTNLQATTDLGLIAFAMDGRYPRPSVPYVRLRSQNGVALPAGYTNGQFFSVIPSVAFNLTIPPAPILLRPGDTLSIYPMADNTALVVNWRGRVRRVANRRELNP